MGTEHLALLLAAVPPEIAGLPTWALNGLSIGSLVGLIITGLVTSRLWTKRQVDELVKQQEREVSRIAVDHTREMDATKARYETHLNRTVELYQGRVNDALAREQERRGEMAEWRDIARQWQVTAEMLAQGIEPMQEQSETTLRILEAWQAESRRKGIVS
jgi:hypothetical protein